MNLVSAHDLVFSYDQDKVLKQVSFEVEEGELIWVQGENGSGKTTLLKLICGILKPNEGSITRHASMSEIGILFARLGFKLSWTVEEIIDSFSEMTSADATEVERAVTLFRLNSLRKKAASELSLGWQKKLALCRLFMKPRKLLILDEPISYLDDDSITVFSKEVVKRVKDGTSVLYTSHLAITGLSPTQWVLKEGKLK